MNEVFLIGKVITEVEFKFIINAKNISIAKFNIETTDKQIIKVEAYNEQADSVFKSLRKEDNIIINGYITTKGTVVLKNTVEKLSKNWFNDEREKIQAQIVVKCNGVVIEYIAKMWYNKKMPMREREKNWKA